MLEKLVWFISPFNKYGITRLGWASMWALLYFALLYMTIAYSTNLWIIHGDVYKFVFFFDWCFLGPMMAVPLRDIGVITQRGVNLWFAVVTVVIIYGCWRFHFVY